MVHVTRNRESSQGADGNLRLCGESETDAERRNKGVADN